MYKFTRNGKTYQVDRQLYKTYYNMIKRTESSPDYAGVQICEEWRKDRNSFYAWALDDGGYQPGLTIDRIHDSNTTRGAYSPENCRWVSRGDNSRNRRHCNKVIISYYQNNQSKAQVSYDTFAHRMRPMLNYYTFETMNWALEQAAHDYCYVPWLLREIIAGQWEKRSNNRRIEYEKSQRIKVLPFECHHTPRYAYPPRRHVGFRLPWKGRHQGC